MRIREHHIYEIISLFEQGLTIKKIQIKTSFGKSFCRKVIKLAGLDGRANLGRNSHETFLKNIKVDKSTLCWNWIGGKNNKGYGQFGIFGKIVLTHRYSYSYFKGPCGVCQVLHECDNPACCNPDHLYLGTQTDNMIDVVRRGRHPYAKLTAKDVVKIRRLKKDGNTMIDIARQYKVGKTCIRGIVIGERYKWVQ